MTNNILYVSDGDYGTPAGYMLPLVQGQYGQSIPVEVRDLAGNVVNLTGYSVLSATKRKGSSVTAWVGTIALSGTPSAAPQVTVTVDEDDTGDYGGYSFFMELSNGSQALKTHPVSLAIVRDPAVNATAAAGLVGVLSSWRSLLGALYNAAQAATNGQVFVFDGSGSGAEGDAAGGGGPVDVTDLTTTTGSAAQRLRVAGAGGLEYRTTEQDLADLRDAGALATPDLGVTVQGYSAKTAAIAALTWAANSIILLTGTATASVQALAAHIVTFLQSASAADARAAIGAGSGNGDAVLASANTFTATQTIRVEDAVTNSTTNMAIINHRSSGTPAVNFGAGISFLLESSTTEDQDAAAIEAYWTSATHATRTVALNLSTYYIGTKKSLQVLGDASTSYAKLIWGANNDIGIWRNNNDLVYSTYSNHSFKVWDGSSYAEGLRIGANGIIDYRGTMGNSTKTVGTDAPADWIEVKIGGTQYFIPVYAA